METAAVTVGEALIGLEERRLLLTQLPGYVWTTDAVLRVTSIVGAPTAMLAPPAGLVGQRLLDLYESPAEAAPAVEAHRRALAGACVAYEVERNGRVFAARVEPLRADGEIVGIVGVAHELTETRRRDERWRRLVEDVDVVLWEADLRRLEVTYVSPVVERLLGFPVERWLGDPGFWRSRIHPDDLWGAPDCGQLPHKDVFELEYRMLAADGTAVCFHDIVRVVRDADGAPQRLSGVLVDVTARRRALDELRRSEERYRSLVEQAMDGIATVSPDGRILDINRAGAAILGGTPEQVIGRVAADFLTDESRPLYVDVRGKLLAGEMPGALAELELVTLEGRRRLVEFRTRIIRTGGGPQVTHGVFRDVTEQRALERSAQHMQRLEALGRLASGVAHDFNNLLTAISGYAHLALAAEGKPVEELTEITRAADRAADLTRQLLAFGRRQVLVPARLDVNDTVRSIERLMQRVIGEEVALELDLTGDELPVVVDMAQLEQALVNLLLNARDAGARSIVVRTAKEWGSAMLGVRDDGGGMDAETAEHAFEPFFTTKPVGQGTGLGLASLHGFVAQSGGAVELDSGPGRGTLVTLRFPLAEPAEMLESTIAASGERVLVVEDDDGVRELMAEVLRRAGFAVTAVDSPRAALEAARNPETRPALLLADVVLPQLGGVELAATIGALVPDVETLFVTGYADELDPAEVAAIGDRLIAKPFAPDDLAGRVRDALAAVRD